MAIAFAKGGEMPIHYTDKYSGKNDDFLLLLNYAAAYFVKTAPVLPNYYEGPPSRQTAVTVSASTPTCLIHCEW